MTNKVFLTQWLLHMVDCEHYGNSSIEEAKVYLETLYNALADLLNKRNFVTTKKTYKDIIKEIEVLISQFEEELQALYTEKAKQVIPLEAEWVSNHSNQNNFVIPSALVATVLFTPVLTNSDYKAAIKKQVENIRQSIESSIRTAYLTKEPLTSTEERINKRKEKIVKQLETGTRTLNTSLFRATDSALFRANKQKMIYISMLDSGTCFVCGSYHGEVFDSDNAPGIPMHDNCRCFLMPLLDDNSELEFDSYSDWIDSLDDEELLDVMGKGRYELYKNGVPVSAFVENDEIITVKDLKKRWNH